MNRYWQVGLTGVTLGGQDVGVQAVSVIIDSGTTAIVMTNPDAQAINSVRLRRFLQNTAPFLQACQPVRSSR